MQLLKQPVLVLVALYLFWRSLYLASLAVLVICRLAARDKLSAAGAMAATRRGNGGDSENASAVLFPNSLC